MSFIDIAQWVFGGILVLLSVVGVAAATGNAGALRLLDRVVDVRPAEVRAMLVATLYFFCALASYFVIRPIRDAVGVAAGVRNLPWLFTATLAAMILFHPVYSSLVARFPVKKFVGYTYAFFAANLIGFFIAWRSVGVNDIWTGRVFYVWTSVFSLFNTSIFWSVMVDTFHTTQAKRLFGFIAVGGTVGSITGSAITAFLAKEIGTANLVMVSTTLLIIAALLVANFPSVPRVTESGVATTATSHQDKLIGGSVWAGILSIFRSPYIAGIALFMLLYTMGSTVLYQSQAEILGKFVSGRDAQTALLAQMEVAAQVLAGLGQTFLTARLIRAGGLSLTLSAVPVLSMIGFAALGATAWGFAPLFATFVVFSVLRRSTEFTLGNPSRKILFTVVSREEKYKASSFVETSVYRLGDQSAVWGYAGLASLGLTVTSIAWLAVPLSAAFLAIALWLAKRQRELAKAADTAASTMAAA